MDLKARQDEMLKRKPKAKQPKALEMQHARSYVRSIREETDEFVALLNNSELLNPKTAQERDELHELLKSLNISVQLLVTYRHALARAAGVKAA
jgi:hypothetical protein